MSYDVSFDIDTGAGERVGIGSRNYTSNVSGMWGRALALSEKPEFNDDGSPRMGSRYDRSAGRWEPVHIHNWGLGLLDGAPASEAAGVLAEAVERMAAAPGEYRPMEPDNDWGDYEGALDFLRWMATMAAMHPNTIIRISR